MNKHAIGELLSSRWTHPCQDGDTPRDRVGYGDISSWSRGTVKAVRPEVAQVKHAPAKPVSLAKAAAFYVARDNAPVKTHNPASVIIPSETKVTPNPCDIGKTFKIQKSYWKALGVKNMDVRTKG